ncbi:hypothetical protein C8F01DRAFT_1266460 [Mycena amicta]|nr:hypothetical protein C8F01DRAFT_1266460 [Mycena amicta]
MPSISTPLTERLGLKTPIVSAPMAFAASPEMAAAVTSGGGFGTLSALFDSSEAIKQKMEAVRKLLGISCGTPLPIAVGFVGWMLDTTEVSDDPRLLNTLNELPVAIWLAFGDIGKWGDWGPSKTPFVTRPKLIVLFFKAGGHGRADAPPLMSLFQAVVQSLPADKTPLLVAAGGITTGAQIAGLLTMGAAGIVVGTRFLFTPECEYSTAAKQAILAADLNATVRTRAYDEVRHTDGWPTEYDGRAIRNAVMDDVEAGLSLEERLAKFDAGKAAGETSRMVVWAGVGAGLIKEIRPVADVLKELHGDAVKQLKASGKMLTSV